MLFWLSTFFSWAMHYLQHIFSDVLILFNVPVPTTAMTFLSPAMGSVRIWSFYFVRKDNFKNIWRLLDLKFVRCLSEWHTSLLLEERNGAFKKETPSLLQSFKIRQCHLTLKGHIKGKWGGGRSHPPTPSWLCPWPKALKVINKINGRLKYT